MILVAEIANISIFCQVSGIYNSYITYNTAMPRAFSATVVVRDATKNPVAFPGSENIFIYTYRRSVYI